jgi:hypothetical protein
MLMKNYNHASPYPSPTTSQTGSKDPCGHFFGLHKAYAPFLLEFNHDGICPSLLHGIAMAHVSPVLTEAR